MSETKLYDVDGDQCLTSLEEDDASAVPRVGDVIVWEVYTYKVMSVLHDIEDRITILHVRKVRDTEEFL